MGEQDVRTLKNEAALRQFSRHLLQDVRALEHMLREDLFEGDVRRIGAEQELFLVDPWGQPASIVEAVLERSTDPRVVTELTKFNLEVNLNPCSFEGDCLRRTEEQLDELVAYVRGIVRDAGGDIVLVGILPTIHISDLTLDHMTERPRYFALNDALRSLRGGPAQFQIRGTDELFLKHDSMMMEGCNTSFQTHFQVSPGEFARYYNLAQAVAGPCMAVATNSPVLFGKRLWRETRIALFQQAVDTRSSNLYLREMSPRVHFGSGWVRESVAEIFQEDISRFRVLLTADEEMQDSMQVLRDGGIPKLKALMLHNGTVYRWNRAVYGITDGKPHLRIENRILPSGPTPADEVANAAFWFGLVCGLADTYDDIAHVLDFDDAKSNFIAAARLGLAAELTWVEGRRTPASDLIGDMLLPLARRGLDGAGIDAADADRYLGIIEQRAETGQTGAQWQLGSLARMKGQGTRNERLQALVAAMIARQQQGAPVHTWDLASFDEAPGSRGLRSARVEHFMTTDLYTVHEDELIEFVATLMDWQRIRHVLVEDAQHRLVGIVSHRKVLRALARDDDGDGDRGGVPVKEIMIRNPITISPEAPSREAIHLMRRHQIGALPVVREDQLLGIVTERDFLHIAGKLLDERLDAEASAPDADAVRP
ncbi:MAG: CBS domain-containing protein [Rhodothermales bacterium]|nr:CBS domain-containing protein [Rhodothermales bacterium]